MIGIILYLICCFIVACVLTVMYVMVRPVSTRDELKSWRILLIMYIVALGGPYAYAEVMTRLVGGRMEQAVTAALDDAGVKGDLQYFKVVYYTGQKARVVAVGKEKAIWGGTDKPVLAVTLHKEGEKWKTDSYRVVNSDNRNQDGFTFPPYY
jgi:hypothetical protein